MCPRMSSITSWIDNDGDNIHRIAKAVDVFGTEESQKEKRKEYCRTSVHTEFYHESSATVHPDLRILRSGCGLCSYQGNVFRFLLFPLLACVHSFVFSCCQGCLPSCGLCVFATSFFYTLTCCAYVASPLKQCNTASHYECVPSAILALTSGLLVTAAKRQLQKASCVGSSKGHSSISGNSAAQPLLT